jgi:hypothetical protein
MDYRNLVDSKAATSIVEGLKITLATPSKSLTPSVLTALVGISNGHAFQVAPAAQSAVTNLASVPNTSPYYGAAQSALANLTAAQSSILPSGNHGAFGAYISQAQSHISDSIEVTKATNFMSNSSYSDFGSGITNMSSLADQGLTGSFKNLSQTSTVMNAAGPCFDVTNMSTFGTGAGLVQQLTKNKLANSTGVNAALTKNNVDVNDLTDPVYSDTINQTLSTINDPAAVASVTEQYGISPYGKINNLADLGDVNKLVNPALISDVSPDTLKTMGTKFSDMGAGFKSPADATAMLNSVQEPSTPMLNATAPSLGGFIASQQPTIQSLTGTGTGPLGVPSMTDFMGPVAGNPEMNEIANGNINSSTIAALESSVSKSSSLFSTAGIDLTSPPPAGLTGSMSFATNLHKFGADTSGSGVGDILGSMANTSSHYGDAITASLQEGKNIAAMQKVGIQPLDFSGQS